MQRLSGYAAVVAGVGAAGAAWAVRATAPFGDSLFGLPPGDVVVKPLAALGVALVAFGLYRLTARLLTDRVADRRRRHDLRNVVRLLYVAAAAAAVFGIITARWVGLLFSLGVVGFAVTFALQQPLFSLLGWGYILLARPYQVGDRVAIEGARGDVIDVDYLVTTLWEIDGDLVSSNQPSGRVVTIPNSVVLSSQVYNYSWQGFPHVWNELSVQVSYETDLAFARELMVEEADDLLGDRMAENVARYRELLAETAVEMEVNDRPHVNVVQRESWVELRLRYLVHPRQGTRTRNRLYERILTRFQEHPERVAFPVGRPR